MNEQEIIEKLTDWMINFVEAPNLKLGNWPPCPFARQARLNNQIKIIFREPENLDYAVEDALDWLTAYEVVIICFDHTKITTVELQNWVQKTNNNLLQMNYVILEDHPDSPEYINGVKMNFGMCGLIIAQKLDKLNSASKQLNDKGYYVHWTQENLDSVVTWRNK